MDYGDVNALKKMADTGDTYAMAQLGILHLTGNRVEQDYEKAFLLLQDAALSSDGEAMLHLGSMYENGYFVEKDLWTAMSLYKKAYTLLVPGARKALGNIYDAIAEGLMLTEGKLFVSPTFDMTACCEKMRDGVRMGRILLLEDAFGVGLFQSSLTQDSPLCECPFCGAKVEVLECD
ncbi:MAG: tetratricopeptide repeat protein [Candidatus Methanomethylophilaceae archaeon]|jgi:hypothetical protein|nr:tetratricopeptide repeat protein [Candidatus Methanomethylophilaceae archaeon]MDD4244992.1 tetratricopeptide repeat protein [Candidatus Methanomethylophilaceae archaeon]MDD4454772.1 tetratricopeptide repeat protein [Candidatus Methanomethylophilaceae archaeon]